MIYAALLIGAFFGACGYAALRLVLANRSHKPASPPERNLFVEMFDELSLPPTRRPPPPMPQCKEARDWFDARPMRDEVTDWDIAVAAERERKHEQENTVRYEFLGITGHEE